MSTQCVCYIQPHVFFWFCFSICKTKHKLIKKLFAYIFYGLCALQTQPPASQIITKFLVTYIQWKKQQKIEITCKISIWGCAFDMECYLCEYHYYQKRRIIAMQAATVLSRESCIHEWFVTNSPFLSEMAERHQMFEIVLKCTINSPVMLIDMLL